jgi:hypothetical protein
MNVPVSKTPTTSQSGLSVEERWDRECEPQDCFEQMDSACLTTSSFQRRMERNRRRSKISATAASALEIAEKCRP